MTHKMKLVNFAFDKIKNKEKDIELRLNDEKRQQINIGDIIEFTNIDTLKTITAKVTNLYKYKTFKEIFDKFPHQRLGFTEQENESIMDGFYTKEEQDKYGAIGIELELI